MTLKRRLDRLVRDTAIPAAASARDDLSDVELLAQIQALLDAAGERGGLPVPRITVTDLPTLRMALAAHEEGG